MSTTFVRKVHFEEVDAAGIVFFARFFNYCHDAMEAFFDAVPGGYTGLITQRKIGFPAVHIDASWKAPLKYGDSAKLEVSVIKIGTTSVTFRYHVTRVSDGVHAATVEHVAVSTDLVTMTKIPLPEDCRVLLESHRA